jgi:hypothetical protein
MRSKVPDWLAAVVVVAACEPSPGLTSENIARLDKAGDFRFLMLAGGFAALMLGKYLARDGANFLIDFLRKTLEARDSQSLGG